MTQLATNVNNQVMIFHDGSKRFITDSQASLIFQASCGTNKSITTPQLGMITFSSIAKIISIEDFYDQYPEERPEYRPEWKETPVEPYKSVQDQIQANEAMRSGVVKGLEQFIREAESRGEKPVNAKKILEDYQKGRLTGQNKKQIGYFHAIVEKYKDKPRNESEEKHYQYALKKINEVKVFS